jgi:hypothetical protein
MLEANINSFAISEHANYSALVKMRVKLLLDFHFQETEAPQTYLI